MSESKMDVRILTLKRLHQPLRVGLYKMLTQELGEPENEGGKPIAHQYYCFQNHQIVSIDRVDMMNGKHTLDNAYRSIIQMRSRDAERLRADSIASSVQQRLVVYGNCGPEWFDDSGDPSKQGNQNDREEPFETLSVSLLQLKDDYEFDDLGRMEEDLLRCVPENMKDRCRLYHALDFCDCVLFIKNATAMEIQQVMWAITYPENDQDTEKPQVLRDSYTILGINIGSLQPNLDPGKKEIKTGKVEILADGLLVSLFVNSAKPFHDYLEHLKEKEAGIIAHKLLGRHDVHIQLPNGKTETLIEIVKELDALCIGEADKAPALCDYEISFLVREDSNQVYIDYPDEKNDRFDKVIEIIRKEYHDYYNSLGPDPSVIGYAANLMNELDTLSKNCFAEEFVNSVLPSFSAYLRCARYCQAEEAYKIKASLQKEYMEALSTMIHCTMHGEKQFVQAPALNLNIVDVPPKMLAYYSAAAFEVTEAVADEFMKEDEKKQYSFLFVPDFRSDINVIRTPYIRNTRFEKNLFEAFENDQLLIVHLNEGRFYSPHQTVAIICHELAHRIDYGDSRFRNARAEYFFAAAASLYVLEVVKDIWSAPKCERISDTQKAFVQNLSMQFSSAILPHYIKYNDNKPQGEKHLYFMTGIESYIRDSNYLYGAFASFGEDDIRNLAKALRKQEIRDLLPLLCIQYDERNGAWLANAYSHCRNQLESPQMECLTMILAQWLYQEIRTVIWKHMIGKQTEQTAKWFGDLASNFGEVYADYRMIELLDLSRIQYENILTENIENWKESEDRRLRYRSVCQAKYQEYDETGLPEPSDEAVILSGFISDYLKQCGNNHWPKMEDYLGLDTKDHMELLEHIFEKLKQYRNKLTSRFIDISSEGAPVASWQ